MVVAFRDAGQATMSASCVQLRSFLILGLAVAATPASSQTPDSATAVRTLLAFEDARFAAMVRADTVWLRDALADDLSYVHSSGRRETKAQYLESLGSGTLRYQEFTPRERQARLLGDTAAVVVGLAHARAVSAGQSFDFDVRYVAVYVAQRGTVAASRLADDSGQLRRSICGSY